MPDIDKTKNHFHQDPKLILQKNATKTLRIGQMIYHDHTGIYKPAIANSRLHSNVQGVVWEFVGHDEFYIKSEPGPMSYRFPFIPNWFSKDAYNTVEENAVIYQYIPGKLGDKVYLSWYTPGGLVADPFESDKIYQQALSEGFNPDFSVLIGFRTEYGLLYRPEPYCGGSF